MQQLMIETTKLPDSREHAYQNERH